MELLTEHRAVLLDNAMKDTIKWCVPPEAKVGKKPSDSFWIKLFSDENSDPVNLNDAHLFLTTFQLTNRVIWHKDRVAALINDLRSNNSFDPVVGIPEFAENMRAANTRATRQTSAASKLANFAKPHQPIFIWDRLASLSARYRIWDENGRKTKLSSASIFLKADRREHDYAAFFAACQSVLQTEATKPDFQLATGKLIEHFRSSTGPMSDPSRVPDAFIQRRLLDKLMFAEGFCLDRKEHPAPS